MNSERRFLSSAVLLAAQLLCCLPAVAQTSAESKPGTIKGRVVNESGRPLPGVTISVVSAGSINLQNPEVFHTTADDEGKFELSGLKPANYRIMAFLKTYVPRFQATDDPQGGVYRAGDFVTLVLTKGGVITGRVTNQAGEPIVGIRVRAMITRFDTQLPVSFNRMGAESFTDDRGIYRIYGLPETTYIVSAGGSGMFPGGGWTSSYIDAFDTDVPTFAPASTRDTAEEITVRAGAETNNIDIQYRGGSGHAVSGSVSGPKGDRALGFGVTLVSVNGPQWTMMSQQHPEDRGFMFNAVDDGDYYIAAVGYRADGEFMFSSSKQITVRGGDLTGVELEVQPFSSVAGRVLLEETKVSECSDKQRPVFTETLVSVQGASGSILQVNPLPLWQTANADERGNVLLKNVPAGRYYFNVQHFAKDWYLKSLSLAVSGKPIDAALAWTTVKPGEQLNGLTITLAQGAASLRGQVALRDGETLPWKSYVYLVPVEKEYAEDVLRYHAAAVAADGKVAIGNLAPGRYFLFAQAATADSPLTKLRSPGETPYRLNLRREAESVKEEIELKPCQKLADVNVRLKD